MWLFAGLAFLVAMGVGAAFIRLDEKSRRETERRAVTEIGLARVSQLEKQLERAFSAAYALSVAVERAGGGDVFESAAADIVDRFAGIGGLALAPSGVVTRTHPAQATGRDEIGQDLSQDPEQAPSAGLARSKGRFTLGGPFPRGRSGLIVFGYLPLRDSGARDGNGSQGLVIVAVRVADLVSASQLARVTEAGYDYRLSRLDSPSGRAVTFARSSELELQDPVRLRILPPGGEWALAIAPRGGWRASASLPRSATLVVVMGLLAGVLTWNVMSKPELLRREVELRTRRLVEANRQVIREVLERERAESRLLHEASHDALTGLANRVYFLSRMVQAIEASRQKPGPSSGVLLLGLDRFKKLNESLGPAAGDQLLLATSKRLAASLRPGDIAARVGGDEFAVLLSDLGGPEAATAVARRLHEALAKPLQRDGLDVFPTVSMGFVLDIGDYNHPEDLLRDADLALHRAKKEGGGRHALFERAMHDRAVRLQVLETELRRAIERKEFRVFYQPIVSLATGRITGFEALVRWLRPETGFVSPGDFIPLAEATGLVIPIDRWVWGEAARQLKELQQRFPREPPLSVSVNLSTKQLREADLLDEVARVLERSALPAMSFRLEITESMMMEDTALTAGILARLKTLDVRLLLDDFGTGYSSMSYLHELPIDVLKVDRSFVSRLGVEPKHSEIVRTIITLAHGLEMDVVAEGIETQGQLASLRQLGANYGQGYLFSKPVPADALEPLLAPDRRW